MLDFEIRKGNRTNLPISTFWPALKVAKFNDGTKNVSTTGLKEINDESKW
jgi:hypothetical protein